jgi:hypothetical protein
MKTIILFCALIASVVATNLIAKHMVRKQRAFAPSFIRARFPVRAFSSVFYAAGTLVLHSFFSRCFMSFVFSFLFYQNYVAAVSSNNAVAPQFVEPEVGNQLFDKLQKVGTVTR